MLGTVERYLQSGDSWTIPGILCSTGSIWLMNWPA